MDFHGLRLDPFQEKAFESVESNRNFVVAAPTGCGKTLIAEYAIEKALAQNKRIFYTGPIKTLSNQKYRDFSARWSADRVGIVTGDISINPHASIVIMTTEIFRNSLFDGQGGSLKDVSWVILDEVHYLGDEERGTVWEESIIFAPPHIHFACLSATVPNAQDFTDWLSHVRQEPVDYILEEVRPVPLKSYLFLGNSPFSFPKLKGLPRQVQKFRRRGLYDKDRDSFFLLHWLKQQKRLPCLYFCFNRRECEKKGQLFLSLELLSEKEKKEILQHFDDLVELHQIEPQAAMTLQMRELVSAGIAFHHAGLLPAIKDIVEQLFTAGQIKILIATETFALGVNMPAASVVFDALKKFNGVQVNWLQVREYTQMSGRAGRRGLDKSGTVVALLEPRDYDRRHLSRMAAGQVEPLKSSFNLSYASLCNLVNRVGSRVGETLEKSFTVYGRSAATRGRLLKKLNADLSLKLEMLEEQNYLENFACTSKGLMAGKLNGFEIVGCQWMFHEAFEGLDDEQLAILFMAVVFESRPNDWYRRPDWDRLEASFAKPWDLIEDWRQNEIDKGLVPIKDLNFQFTHALIHWYRGGEFSDFSKFTSAGEGDIVRHFLLCCQFLRQMAYVVKNPELSERFKNIRACLFRDVMDAESQLRRLCTTQE